MLCDVMSCYAIFDISFHHFVLYYDTSHDKIKSDVIPCNMIVKKQL